MDLRSLLLIAIAPVVILLSYIHKKDPNPEPKKILRRVFVLGCLTVIPVMIAEIVYESLFNFEEQYGEAGIFLDVFFGVALIEEFFKWIVVFILCYRSKDFDETYDAIVYASFSSLAFACIENILYVFLRGGAILGLARAFTAIPGHLFNAILMGYCLGKARLAKSQGKSSALPLLNSLLIPTITHCFYDFFLFADHILIWIIYMVAISIVCISIVKSAAKNNTAIASISDITPASALPTPVAPTATSPTPVAPTATPPTPVTYPTPVIPTATPSTPVAPTPATPVTPQQDNNQPQA